jgi:hypothetical protein
MPTKKSSGGRRQIAPEQPQDLGEVMKELYASPAEPVASKPMRARRAGPFKVPASMAGPRNSEREILAQRFKQHLRGVSGANKLGPDPDETVPVVRPRQRPAVRPGPGFRPGMPSHFGRPYPSDDEDE